MIYVIGQFVNGPFDTERRYQNVCMEKLKLIYPEDTFVRLETEETESGIPDVVRLSPVRSSLQIEFKVSNDIGNISFKKSQPLWYRQHSDLHVVIVAWDKRFNRSVLITADEIVKNASRRFNLPEELPTRPFANFVYSTTWYA